MKHEPVLMKDHLTLVQEIIWAEEGIYKPGFAELIVENFH